MKRETFQFMTAMPSNHAAKRQFINLFAIHPYVSIETYMSKLVLLNQVQNQIYRRIMMYINVNDYKHLECDSDMIQAAVDDAEFTGQ